MILDIMQRIERSLVNLSPAEQKVAQWVRGHPLETLELPIAQLAENAGVSEPTIIRFCRSLGLAGFRALKTHLVAVSQQPASYVHQDVQGADGVEVAVGKVLDNAIRALMDIRATASDMPFDKAAALFNGARQIVFVGVGASGRVAEDARHKFFRLGIPCATATDAQTIAQSAAIAQQSDVYVALSHNGHWPEVVEMMRLARSNGARIVAVTDPNSALARTADCVFACHPPEDTSVYTPMSSRLAQLAVLDALHVALSLSLGSDAEAHLRASKRVLNDTVLPAFSHTSVG